MQLLVRAGWCDCFGRRGTPPFLPARNPDLMPGLLHLSCPTAVWQGLCVSVELDTTSPPPSPEGMGTLRSQGRLGVVGPERVARSSEMSSWPFCVFVAHIWRQLQMLSSGSSAKHSWSQWRSMGRGDCQREEEGVPRALASGVWFPHHEEIVWP